MSGGACARTFAWVALGLLAGCSRNVERAPSASSAGRAPTERSARPRAEPAARAQAAAPLPPSRRERARDLTFEPLGIQPAERLPLLVVLHGLGGSGSQSAAALELARFAERERVIVLAPDGSKDSAGRRFWNAHPACCDFDASGVDHVREVGQRIDAVVHGAPVDDGRIFLIGFSNGGFMALRLACALGPRLRGVASIAGAGPGPGLNCNSELPHVLLVHGDSDTVVRYEGGSVFDHPALPRHASASETFEEWADRAGCQNAAPAAAPFDAVASIVGYETVELSAQACRRGSVRLWTVRGGTHAIGGSTSLIERIWADFAARS